MNLFLSLHAKPAAQKYCWSDTVMAILFWCKVNGTFLMYFCYFLYINWQNPKACIARSKINSLPLNSSNINNLPETKLYFFILGISNTKGSWKYSRILLVLYKKNAVSILFAIMFSKKIPNHKLLDFMAIIVWKRSIKSTEIMHSMYVHLCGHAWVKDQKWFHCASTWWRW